MQFLTVTLEKKNLENLKKKRTNNFHSEIASTFYN